LSLRFERLNEKKDNNDNEDNQDAAFFGGQFKGKCRNCGMMDHKSSNCKNKIRQNGFQNGSQTNNLSGGQNRGNQVNLHNGAYCTYCCRPGHYRSNYMKLKKKHNRNSGTSTHNNQEIQVLNYNDVAFKSFETKNNLSSDVWILDNAARSLLSVYGRIK
jgi:hypothetical protein